MKKQYSIPYIKYMDLPIHVTTQQKRTKNVPPSPSQTLSDAADKSHIFVDI